MCLYVRLVAVQAELWRERYCARTAVQMNDRELMRACGRHIRPERTGGDV